MDASEKPAGFSDRCGMGDTTELLPGPSRTSFSCVVSALKRRTVMKSCERGGDMMDGLAEKDSA